MKAGAAASSCHDAAIVCALSRAPSIGCITRMKEEEGAAGHSGQISTIFQAFAVGGAESTLLF